MFEGVKKIGTAFARSQFLELLYRGRIPKGHEYPRGIKVQILRLTLGDRKGHPSEERGLSLSHHEHRYVKTPVPRFVRLFDS